MLKKFVLGAVALGSLGAAALAPSTASAGYWGWHGHHHYPVVRHYYVPQTYAYYRDPCIVKRRVWTDYGWRWRRVNVCY